MLCWNCIVLIGVFLISVQASDDSSGEFLLTEGRLIDKLLTGYHPAARPVRAQNDSLRVNLNFYLVSIEDLDEAASVLISHIWLIISWKDYQLSWNRSQYDDISYIRIPMENVWNPDIQLYNSIDTYIKYETPPFIYSSGNIWALEPVRLKSSCQVDITRFPFDTQTCTLRFGSWSYNGAKVNVTTYERLFISRYMTVGEYNITNTKVKRQVKIYSCCPDRPYITVVVTLTLARHTSAYTHLFVAPAVVTSLSVPFIFMLQADSSHRFVLGVGVLIGHILMYGQLENFVPHAYPRVPVIGVFFLVNIVLVVLALILSTIFNNMWKQKGKVQRLPACVHKVFLGVLARLLLVAEVQGQQKVMDYNRMTEPTNPNGEVDGGKAEVTPDNTTAWNEWCHLLLVLDRMLCAVYLGAVVIMTIVIAAY